MEIKELFEKYKNFFEYIFLEFSIFNFSLNFPKLYNSF